MLILQIFQSYNIGALFSAIGWVDVLLLLIFAWGTFVGFMRGLRHQLPIFIALYITVIVTMNYYERISDVVVAHSAISLTVVQIISFFLLAVGSNVLARGFFQVTKSLVEVDCVYILERFVGAIVGAFRFVLFFSLLSFFVNILELSTIQRLYIGESIAGPAILTMCPRIHDCTVRVVKAVYKEITREKKL